LSAVYDLEKWMKNAYTKEKDSDQQSHLLFGLELIRRFRDNPELFRSDEILKLPMGSPIGNGLLYCDF